MNHERALRGRALLRPDGRLNRAATRHAFDMAGHKFFGHISSNGDRLSQRIDAVSSWRAWRWVGEVLGWSCTAKSTPRDIVDAWLTSAVHRRLLTTRLAGTVGVGPVPGTPYSCDGFTWTVELGKQRRRL